MSPAETVLYACWRAACDRGDAGQAGRLERALNACGEPARPVDDLQAAAVWYANRGLRVLPVLPGGKRPLPGTHGVRDATCDHARIAGWFEIYAGAEGRSLNIGIACGGPLDVLDVDGAAGAETFMRALGGGAWLDVAAVSETPRGVHLWTPADPGAVNDAGGGFDYRGRGGYVVAPPSHVGGTLYRWLLPPAGVAS